MAKKDANTYVEYSSVEHRYLVYARLDQNSEQWWIVESILTEEDALTFAEDLEQDDSKRREYIENEGY